MAQLEDSSSDAFGALIGAFDRAVTEFEDKISDSFEPQMDRNPAFESFMDAVQEKIEKRDEETVVEAELAEYTYLLGTEEEVRTNAEANEHRYGFTYGFLGLLAVTGFSLYVKSRKTQTETEAGNFLVI